MWERKTWWYHTSISARGVSAETESTHIRSTAPERHIRSATVQSNEERKQVSFYMKIRFKTRDLRMFWDYLLSKAISPLSGWHTMRFSTSTPNALEYDGSKACSASTSIALPPSFCTSEIAWSASVVLPLLSGPYICSIHPIINKPINQLLWIKTFLCSQKMHIPRLLDPLAGLHLRQDQASKHHWEKSPCNTTNHFLFFWN